GASFHRVAEVRHQGVSGRRVPQLPQKTSADRSCFPQFAQTGFRTGAGRGAAAPLVGAWMGLPHLEQNFSLGSEPLPQLGQAQPVRINLANRAPIPWPGPGPAAGMGPGAWAGTGPWAGGWYVPGPAGAGPAGAGPPGAGPAVGMASLACARD